MQEIHHEDMNNDSKEGPVSTYINIESEIIADIPTNIEIEPGFTAVGIPENSKVSNSIPNLIGIFSRGKKKNKGKSS